MRPLIEYCGPCGKAFRGRKYRIVRKSSGRRQQLVVVVVVEVASGTQVQVQRLRAQTEINDR
ncbi:hypothetical protein BLOT_015926 [Blomia tropicalis]|nr:hypothetical protein BLOT_015926 [Blomia tropicalis]